MHKDKKRKNQSSHCSRVPASYTGVIMRTIKARLRCAYVLFVVSVGVITGAFFRPTPAFAWGGEGHRIVALIAASELAPRVKAQVETLLGGDSMADLSIWADEIKFHRHETSPWHYVDIEIDSQGYDAARDCPTGDCVVAQIERDERIASDRSLAMPVRAEALKFLIHFVGDLHQPLHCADNHDRGGNEVKVILGRRSTNLHAVWDNDVVKALGRDPDTVAVELEQQIAPQQVAQWQRGSVAEWANQSFHVAKSEIYGQLSGTGSTDAPIILDPDYARDQHTIVSEQLEKAGARLASVLNRVLR